MLYKYYILVFIICHYIMSLCLVNFNYSFYVAGLCGWSGTIILDTVCLSESAGRTTPKDEAIIAKLQALRPSLDRQKIFDELLTIKHNDTASTVMLCLFTVYLLCLLVQWVLCVCIAVIVTQHFLLSVVNSKFCH